MNTSIISWHKDSKRATHWQVNNVSNSQQVKCKLCPRNCTLNVGQIGFCGVRKNINGELHTLNYGKAVEATLEYIETEAVNHFAPSARILNLGNIGCMLSCKFCQNWETSQVKHLDEKFVKNYTSEQIVDIALKNNIKILSWTYNDPVVWHEFVMDTSKLAKKHGLKILYKSAFYIEEEPVKDLLEVVDIFSISLKSLSSDFYKKYTMGRLEPVLKAIEQIAASDKHLEISQLIVTGLNDKSEDAQETVKWFLNTVGPEVPLHFVAFHPAYQYTNTVRTPPEVLIRAREIALKEGVKHCYLGNVHLPEFSSTHCEKCGNLLVERYGLKAQVVGLDEHSNCTQCSTKSPIKEPFLDRGNSLTYNFDQYGSFLRDKEIIWNNECNSIHLSLNSETSQGNIMVNVERIPTKEQNAYVLNENLSRIIVTKNSENEEKIKISWNSNTEIEFLPILDRAHFPVC